MTGSVSFFALGELWTHFRFSSFNANSSKLTHIRRLLTGEHLYNHFRIFMFL